MFSKQKVRNKFLLLRKKKYFDVNDNFFKPLIRIINREKKRKISLYYPSNYEVNTLSLLKNLGNKKKFSTLLPKILSNGKMKFISWKFFEPLAVNRFGFLEPESNGKSIEPELMVVPLLAFDKFKNRLGYGKGYYDKFLSEYILKKKDILIIGVAFSFQQYKKLPTSKFDIKLNYILTEKGLF